MPRRAISKEDIQDLLMDAATSLFLEKGIYNTEVKEIASRAGLSLSSLYRHAIDKSCLSFRVVTNLMMEVTKPVLALDKIEGELGIDRLRRLCYTLLDECQNHPNHLVVINEFDTIYRGDYPRIDAAKLYVILMQRLANQALQYVLEAISDGSMKHIDNPQLYSATLQNTVLGLSLRFFPREQHFEEEHHSEGRRMVEEAIERMLDAVRP